MTPEQKEKFRIWRRRAAVLGVLVGLLCKSLPPEYQGPCHTLAEVCTGGLF